MSFLSANIKVFQPIQKPLLGVIHQVKDNSVKIMCVEIREIANVQSRDFLSDKNNFINILVNLYFVSHTQI